MQQNDLNGLRALGSMREPVEIPAWMIAQCQTFGDAVALSLQFGKKTLDRAAGSIGMSKSHLCEVTKNRKHFPMGKARDFAYYVGNMAIQQWVAHDMGLRLVQRPETGDEKLARLEAENAELKARAA